MLPSTEDSRNMIYKSYIISLGLRVVFLFIVLTGLAFGLSTGNMYLVFGAAVLTIFSFYNLYKFAIKRFVEMDDFFESVKYRDFSRWFTEENGPQDIRELHKGFNAVNRTIKAINSERQAQYVYLQKILEMVDIGIIAYNLESGAVLWANESLKKTLDFPSFKNVSFVEKRMPVLYEDIFETYHSSANSVTLTVKNEQLKVLISDTVFQVENESFKLIVLQNIDETLNRNESEAWKKLLSVMTHEIMNSIAPISSLADTLQHHIQANLEEPAVHKLEMEDLAEGIKSIQKRSEGLMKFAQTYRSLNKVTHLNLSTVLVGELFQSINSLMQPTLVDKAVTLQFHAENPELELEIDAYLIEQVLINLILNAIDACEDNPEGKIRISASLTMSGNSVIQVADNGKGIPEEILDSIFVPFFSTKKNGSGIGLSLCKQIMMLHKGKIQINSTEEKGTAINLLF